MKTNARSDKQPLIQLTSWYINPHRVLELTGSSGSYQSITLGSSGDLGKTRLMSETSVRLVQWLRENPIPPLETLFLENKLKRGQLFTYDGRFFSRGLAADNSAKDGVVRLRLSLKDFGDPRELFLEFHADGLTTWTARSKLMGQPSVFTLAYIDSVGDGKIIARPYVIADLVEHSGNIDWRYRDRLEIPLFSFDHFKDVDFTKRVSKSQLEKLRKVPEKIVKQAFADLIGEAAIQKDWGGEQCDLFTGNLSIDGVKQTGAFLFKGRSKFKLMEISDCGKKADQIIRLFEVGAAVSILQHCHAVSPAVRKMMAACARSDLNSRRRYAIVDGYATFQILAHAELIPNSAT
jgi:hypothetical protein